MLMKALKTNAICTVLLLLCAYIQTRIDAKLGDVGGHAVKAVTRPAKRPNEPPWLNWRQGQPVTATPAIDNDAMADRQYYEGIQNKFLAFLGLPTVIGLFGSYLAIGGCCLGRLFRRPVVVEEPAPMAVPEIPAAELPDYFKQGLEENKEVTAAEAAVEVPS